ncbi:uncharacterized protein LOC120194843 [Hibiscus syriacus]|uniref:uncharacterized protein LOC120194843 n=1 Tax=Hibiscus syriacus TaxID=106335 RepID=UPI0019231264|nr:uncharacterized protein LOC120194843 [Hibiscus syriacus]
MELTPSATSTGSNTNTTNKSTNPAMKYYTQEPSNRNNFRCHFCPKVVKGGVYRMKWHFIGGLSDVTSCPNCPEHVKEEVRSFMQKKKEMETIEKKMNSTYSRRFDYSDYDLDEDDDYVEVQGDSTKMSQRKKPRQKARWFYDGVGPSRNDKGKRPALVDEDEIEEDIGVTDDDEGDGDVLGFDDEDLGDI